MARIGFIFTLVVVAIVVAMIMFIGITPTISVISVIVGYITNNPLLVVLGLLGIIVIPFLIRRLATR